MTWHLFVGLATGAALLLYVYGAGYRAGISALEREFRRQLSERLGGGE